MKTFDPKILADAVRLRGEGWSYDDIKTITGVGRSTVIKYAGLSGQEPRKSGPCPLFDEKTRALACRLYAAEQTMDFISSRTGASRDMIRRWALAAGLPPRTVAWRAPRKSA